MELALFVAAVLAMLIGGALAGAFYLGGARPYQIACMAGILLFIVGMISGPVGWIFVPAYILFTLVAAHAVVRLLVAPDAAVVQTVSEESTLVGGAVHTPIRGRPNTLRGGAAAAYWVSQVYVAGVLAVYFAFAFPYPFTTAKAIAERRARGPEVRADEERRQKALAVMQAREEQERARAERALNEAIAFFRGGGRWSKEVFHHEEAAPAAPPDAAPSPSGGIGPAGTGAPQGAAGSDVVPKQRVLVLGPRGLLAAKPAVRLGVAVPRDASDAGKAQEVESVLAGDRRQEFYQRFADALARGEVEAAVVEVEPAVVRGSLADGVGGGREGDDGSPKSLGIQHDSPVPLDKAVALTRERLLATVGGP